MKKRDSLIKNIYLYLITFVGIIISVIGSITLIDLGLKSYVFTSADTYIRYPQPRMIEGEEKMSLKDEVNQEAFHEKETSSRRQRQAANAIAMLVVGYPLYYYHWSLLQKKSGGLLK